MDRIGRIVTQIRDFPGLVTDLDPHDRQEGMAVDQVNAMSTDMGELHSRPGYRFVQFEETISLA